MSEWMGGCKHDSDTFERSVFIRVATQFVLETMTVDPRARPLNPDVIHEVLPGLGELIYQIWDPPFNRAPVHGSWGRFLLAVRGMICLFMPAGISIAFP
eukprot:1212832-Pyramimonas_sp.AAC.1